MTYNSHAMTDTGHQKPTKEGVREVVEMFLVKFLGTFCGVIFAEWLWLHFFDKEKG